MTNGDRIPPTTATPRQPPTGLLVRAISPRDADAITEMHNLPGFRWGTLRLPFQAPEEIKNRIEKAAPGSVNLVAVLDGRIVGAAGLDRHQGRRSHAAAIGMGVHDAWIGQGIGTALLAALIDMADRWLGIRRLELTVFADNLPAIALYRRFGFEIEGTHRGFALRDGRYVDAHAMARFGGPAD